MMRKLLLIVFAVFALSVSVFAENVSVLDLRENEHYFEITDNANNDLDLGTDYTIEAWIYVKDTTHGNERIFRSQGWQIYVQSGTGDGANATIIVSGTFMPAGTISMSVPTEEWHHIALQGNSAGWTNNYLDGAAIGNGGATDISGSLNLRIGSYGTSTTDFVGCIDEVRISTGNRYSRWGFTVNRNDAPFTNDANTVLLYHFDDNALPPTNSSSMSFTTTNVGITTDDYLVLPVTLTSFTAMEDRGQIKINWETASEINNAHFVIYRNGMAITTVEGAGTSSKTNYYSYIDSDIIPGVNYTYVLADVDYANVETKYEDKAVTVAVKSDIIEADFTVGTAYPNPFNPLTVVPFTLSRHAIVKASLYDMSGRKVKSLVNKDYITGTHELHIDASGLTSGTYLLQMIIENTVLIQRLTLMK
jgi:hypothetical protein